MSKLHSSIQKAIDKSRRGQKTGTKARLDSRKPAPGSGDRGISGIFRAFRAAKPDREIMEESRIVSAIDDKSAISAYNLMRTRVLQRMRSNNWRSVLITSPGAGEGKTLTSSNLAVSLARDVNQSVVLVDLDLQRSTVAKYFGMVPDVKAGMGEYLTGKAELSDIVYVPSDLERIALIPNRGPVENSSDLLGGPRMREFLDWLHAQGDDSIVVFDMPPVLACDDVLAFCPHADCVLLVVAEGQTDRAGLKKTMDLLAESNLLGVVLNKTDEVDSKDGYGYY